MRIILSFVALVAVAACAPQVPDSGAGVGFQDYAKYQEEKRKRDAQLAANALPPPEAIAQEPLDGFQPVRGAAVATHSNTDADLAADTQAVLQETSANSGQGVVHASPSNPAPVRQNNSGISDENDFTAVGSRRTIENDADLIAQNQAQYKVIEAQALPTRVGSGGPNIVEYALRSKHSRGTQVYRRVGINKDAKFQRNCANYPSADRAQTDFLAKGGPQRDKLGLDPDGDGYACAWDPAPFRKAVNG